MPNTQAENKKIVDWLKNMPNGGYKNAEAIAPYLNPRSAELGAFYYNDNIHELTQQDVSKLTPNKVYLRNLETGDIKSFNTQTDLENYLSGYIPNRQSLVQITPRTTDFSTGEAKPGTVQAPPVYPMSGTPQAEAANKAATQGTQLVTTGGGTSAESSTITPPPATSAFKNSDSYKALSTDMQQLIDLAFSTFSGTPEQQKVFSDALIQAQELADPYSKSQLALAGAEFGLAIAKTKNDYETQFEILNRTRKDIADTLALNKDSLSLQEQAAISKELKNYNEDLLTIADQAAEKGITFATGARSRALAEERRTGQYQDVIQSTQRTANLQKKELELRASQGDTEAQKKLDALNVNKGFELTNIGQAAEKVLGSVGAGALGLEGFTPQGGALGSIEQQRREAIINTAQLGLPK